MDSDEVYRRLPALDFIRDADIRKSTANLSAEAPAYFWTVPASTSGYHHPLCRREHGLWAHTLMVSTAIERLIDSWEARFDVDPDYARAAGILHDQRKNGDPSAPSETSVSDHDLQMGQVVRDSGLPDEIAVAVDEHMGAWYDGPEPSTPLSELVHAADMMASTENATIAVPGPVPEELAALGVEEASL